MKMATAKASATATRGQFSQQCKHHLHILSRLLRGLELQTMIPNENSDSPSHKDGQTPTTTSNENEDGGFSEFIAYLRLSEEAQQMQTGLGQREGAEDNSTKDQWQCSTCSYINKNPLHLTCDICGTARVVQNQELKLKQGMK